MSDNNNPARGNSGAATFLRDIEEQSPFEAGGRLPRDIRGQLLGLDPESLGRAITILLRHAAGLPPIERSVAAETIEALLATGPAGSIRVEIDVPGLVELYRDLGGDRSRQAISELVARLLREADPEAAAQLDRDDGRTMAEPPGRGGGPTRGMDFPPLTSAEPRAGEEPTTGAEPTDGAAEPSARPRTYRAYGLLESDETVLVGRPFELKVGLSPTSPPGVAGPPLEVPRPDAKPYDLDIQLFADGFDLAPDESWRHSLPVSVDDLYPSVTVHLTARALPQPQAIRSITAMFTIAGETLGAATRQIIVTSDPAAVEVATSATTATGTNITAPTGQPPADVTITIKRGLEPGALQWSIESNLPGVALPHDRPAESDIGNDPKEFATAIIRKLLVQTHHRGVTQLLQGIGKTIRDEMPRAVRTAIVTANAAVAPRPVDILLLTEEPFIPWELAWIDEPFDKKAPPYLGAQSNIGRWALEPDTTPTDPPRQLNAATIAVVWGVYNTSSLERLEAAEDEAKQIQDQYHAASIDARPELVYPLLEGEPPSDILHFAVHGRYNPQGVDEGIYLVDGPPIDPLQIRGSDLSKRSPFVFLNVCQVGAGQNLLGNYAGIAQAFLKIGASGVVAPLWSIDDKIAEQIALEFYKYALQPAEEADGKAGDQPEPPTVADLLRRVRAEVVENGEEVHESTHLAYQFYGHPSLRLSWKPAAAAGGP